MQTFHPRMVVGVFSALPIGLDMWALLSCRNGSYVVNLRKGARKRKQQLASIVHCVQL